MSEDANEQHQEQPPAGGRPPGLADGCCPVAVAAPERVRGRPFPPGVSGNPAGRLPGTRNRATMAAEALLDGEAQALTRKAIELALAGDTTALRLCLERIMPARKSRTLKFEMPGMERAEDLPAAMGAILDQVAEGNLQLDEAAALIGMLEAKRRAIETTEIEARLKALEARSGADGK